MSPLISAPRVLDFLRNRAILGGSNMRLLPGGSTYHSCAEWAVPNGSVRGNPGFLSLALGGWSPPVRVSRKRSGRPETSDAKEGGGTGAFKKAPERSPFFVPTQNARLYHNRCEG